MSYRRAVVPTMNNQNPEVTREGITERLVCKADDPATVEEIVQHMHPVAIGAPDAGRLGIAAGTPGLEIVRRYLAADGRLRVIAGDKGRRLRLRALVTNLDTPLGEGDSTQVVYIRYADAEQLVPILEASLQSLLGQDAAAAGKEGQATSFIRAHKDTNALVITAPPAVTRELRNVIERASIICSEERVQVSHLGLSPQASPSAPQIGDQLSLQDLEKAHISAVMANSESLDQAAKTLGIDASTLYRKRKQLSL